MERERQELGIVRVAMTDPAASLGELRPVDGRFDDRNGQ